MGTYKFLRMTKMIEKVKEKLCISLFTEEKSARLRERMQVQPTRKYTKSEEETVET